LCNCLKNRLNLPISQVVSIKDNPLLFHAQGKPGRLGAVRLVKLGAVRLVKLEQDEQDDPPARAHRNSAQISLVKLIPTQRQKQKQFPPRSLLRLPNLNWPEP
jgi:hypothetical protein